MSHSDSEEQFLEIKEFLAKTWKIFVAVIFIGLVSIWGWRYWQSHKIQTAFDASDKYELLISKLNPDDPRTINDLVSFAKEDNSTYGIFAALKTAQIYVEYSKDYAGAEALLIDASKKTDSESMLAVVNLRIARLQNQLEKYEDSLNTLDKISGENWIAPVNDIRGDVLVNLQRYAEACDAYNVALISKPIEDLERHITIKLNQAEYLKAKHAVEQ